MTIGSRSFPRCGESAAVDFARVLLGCYRKIDAADADVYTRAVVGTLAFYPAFVSKAVCDPLQGLPAKLKWPPTIAELREACERELEPTRREVARLAKASDTTRRQAPPDERARVLEGFRKLRAELGA